jgi:hypothetical protein
VIPGSASPFFLGSSLAVGGGGAGYQIERSLRFNSSDSGFCSRTPAVAGSRTTWSFSCWIKRSKLGGYYRFFTGTSGNTDNDWTALFFNNSDQLTIGGYTSLFRTSNSVYRDCSAWYHLVVIADLNNANNALKFRAWINNVEVTWSSTSTNPTTTGINATNNHTIGAEQSPNNGALNSYFDGYLADIHFIDGQALTPSSFTEVSATTGQLIPLAYSGSFGTNGFWLKFSDNSAATAAALGNDYSGNNNDWTPNNFSVTQGTGSYTTNTTGTFAANRGAIKAFDGATSGSDFYAQPADGNTVTIGSLGITGITQLRMWLGKNAGGDPWGTLTLNATNVTSFLTTNYPSLTSTGQWIDLTSQLPGSTLSTITMTSPVANTDVRLSAVEVNGIVLIDRAASTTAGNDSLVDTPTSISATDTGVGDEVRGNYCTWNPLNGIPPLSDGNLRSGISGSNIYLSIGTIGPTSNKWYFEVFIETATSPGQVGVLTSSATTINAHIGGDAYGWGIFCQPSSNGCGYHNGVVTANLGVTYAQGDIVQCAYDLNSGKIWFGRNGTWANSGDPSNGTNAVYTNLPTDGTPVFPAVDTRNYGGGGFLVANFGQRAFAYTAPSGFKALCDTNLGAPVVAKPNTAFDTVLWTGNDTGQTITMPGAFSPDLVWTKMQSAVNNHWLFDVIRGADQGLSSSSTTNELTRSSSVTAFGSTGFTLGTNVDVNSSAYTYVGWAWDAGSSTVSNPDGSITSQVRANVSAGFSVVGFNSGSSGAKTIGHGLGVAPSLLICKNRDGSANWTVYHSSATNVSQFLMLNSTNAVGSSSNIWGSAAPTSTVFGFDSGTNQAANVNIICYAFAPVVGYSNGFSYVGNASSDGPYTYLGFRSRFIIIKRTDTTGDWLIYDTARDSYNTMTKRLYPNLSNAEADASDQALDVTANGFKVRANNGNFNASGGTYIGFAFAESPFQYARAR